MLLKLSKVSSKGQITIPADIRHNLNLAEGDTIIFIQENDNIIIKKKDNSTLVSILGETGPLTEKAKDAMKNIRNEWH